MPVAGKVPANSKPMIGDARFDRRLDLLSRLESDYAAQAPTEVADHQKLYGQAQRMVHSPQMTAFDLSTEPQAIRDAYGTSPFAHGLLARAAPGGNRRSVRRGGCRRLGHAFRQFRHDQAAGRHGRSAVCGLLADLASRGMLDKTLVVWMGEFGRTPHINARNGRDHYPTAFNVVLAGGGVRGGQVIGKTDAGGTEVTDRPVRVPDLVRLVLPLVVDRSGQREHEQHRPADQAGRWRPGRQRAVRLERHDSGLSACAERRIAPILRSGWPRTRLDAHRQSLLQSREVG